MIAEYRRLYPAYSPSDVLFAATTAARSWRAAIIEAEERAKAGTPAFAYQLDWVSPKDGGKFGAPHTADIPLVSASYTELWRAWESASPAPAPSRTRMSGVTHSFSNAYLTK